MSYSKTGLPGPSSAVTKLGWTVFEEIYAKIGRCWHYRVDFVSKNSIVRKCGWTVFEEVYAKIGRCWQCKVDFISKKSIVRKCGPETVLTALIVILRCTV